MSWWCNSDDLFDGFCNVFKFGCVECLKGVFRVFDKINFFIFCFFYDFLDEVGDFVRGFFYRCKFFN